MSNVLAKNHSLGSLLIFALPNMLMMLFLSLYTIIDGMFVSHFVGTTALSAINMVYPAVNVELAIGIMIATGGTAIIAKQMGEDQYKRARENFSFLVLVEGLIGIAFAIFGNLFVDTLIPFFGATAAQYDLCRDYITVLFGFAPCFFLQVAFQSFFVAAGKPGIGLGVTVASGLINIVLDYLFIVPFDMGIAGAAWATGLGYSFAAVFGLIYFTLVRHNLYFVRPRPGQGLMFHACTNGSSEMVTNLANAVTTFLYNLTFLHFLGEDGVAAITIALYFEFVFSAIFFGYAQGIAPVVSFNYGARNHRQLQHIYRSSFVIIACCAVLAFAGSIVIVGAVLSFFTPVGSNVYRIMTDGFGLYAIAFLFMGVTIFASAWFTALSNGKVSALVSFARTFIFLVGAILLLPQFLGATGAWLALPCAEVLAMGTSFFCLRRYKAQYHY